VKQISADPGEYHVTRRVFGVHVHHEREDDGGHDGEHTPQREQQPDRP